MKQKRIIYYMVRIIFTFVCLIALLTAATAFVGCAEEKEPEPTVRKSYLRAYVAKAGDVSHDVGSDKVLSRDGIYYLCVRGDCYVRNSGATSTPACALAITHGDLNLEYDHEQLELTPVELPGSGRYVHYILHGKTECSNSQITVSYPRSANVVPTSVSVSFA